MNLAWRLAVLLALMAAIAWIDWRRHGDRATKWREYAFLLIAAVIGGALGIAIDQLTASISPAYFVVGKGIQADDSFRLHVAELGFQAGLGVGAAIGGIFLIANNPRLLRRSLSGLELFRFALGPFIAALLLAPLGGWIIHRWDPLNFAADLSGLLDSSRIERFQIVWGLHLGIYAGGALGTVLAVVGIRRRRIGPA